MSSENAARVCYDVAIIGGGLVGAAVAYGLARRGRRVVILDEGDAAIRASRGNFALVWVQAKGLGMPAYSRWTVASSESWAAFAGDLARETGIDVHFQRPGGFQLCLSEREFEARRAALVRFHNQPEVAGYRTEMLERAEMERMLPGLGRDVAGGSFCPLDGHVNSLKLFRALFAALGGLGAVYRANSAVDRIERRGGVFRIAAGGRVVEAGKVVLAAGNANQALAPLIGLTVPMRPERGQILVTERAEPFLRHPMSTVRQTDEGSVMIGDSREEATDPAEAGHDIGAMMAARAVRAFPQLARLNVVRMWSAIRVMPQDGFPIYEQSTTMPGAFVVTCHSGVTLAAAHALYLAPMIDAGALDAAMNVFGTGRFDVPAAG